MSDTTMTPAALDEAFGTGISESTEPFDVGSDTLSLAAQYSELVELLRSAESEAEAIKDRMSSIEPVLLERMQESGTQNIRSGKNTLYVKQTFYVSKRKDIETAEVIESLREHGLGYLVSEGYNAASLRGKVREMLDAGQEIPETLEKRLNIGSVASVAHRRA